MTVAPSDSGARAGQRQLRGAGVSSISADLSQPPATAELVWRDPPADRRRRVLSAEIVEQLRANRGRWAVIRRYHNRTAVKGGDVVKHPADIEVRGVEEPPGSVLYARARPTERIFGDIGVGGGGR